MRSCVICGQSLDGQHANRTACPGECSIQRARVAQRAKQNRLFRESPRYRDRHRAYMRGYMRKYRAKTPPLRSVE